MHTSASDTFIASLLRTYISSLSSSLLGNRDVRLCLSRVEIFRSSVYHACIIGNDIFEESKAAISNWKPCKLGHNQKPGSNKIIKRKTLGWKT